MIFSWATIFGIWELFIIESEFAIQDPKLILTAHPLNQSAWLLGVVMVYSFLESIRINNYSVVDRLWSIAPFVYPLFFVMSNPHSHRLVLMASLCCLWGFRLSFNLYRKGGYSNKHQDYRFDYLMKVFMDNPYVHYLLGWIAYQLFNLTFIATYQHFLIWLISAIPTYIVFEFEKTITVSDKSTSSSIGVGLNQFDYLITVLFLIFILIETIADNQQFKFQTQKHSKIKNKEKLVGDEQLGFLTHGLFKYSRHPNFFAEQSIWWTLSLFTISVQLGSSFELNTFYLSSISHLAQFFQSIRLDYFSGSVVASVLFPFTSSGANTNAAQQTASTIYLFHWGFIGAVLLTLLFQGSTWLTEYLSVQKYPAYVNYQKVTSRLIPLWSRGKVYPVNKEKKFN